MMIEAINEIYGAGESVQHNQRSEQSQCGGLVSGGMVVSSNWKSIKLPVHFKPL